MAQLKKDYGYSSVLFEDVISRVKEIIVNEYNIQPYIAPNLDEKKQSPFRIWPEAQETTELTSNHWFKKYTISINQYLKKEHNEKYFEELYKQSERLYEILFINLGTKNSDTNYKVDYYNGTPTNVNIIDDENFYRIEVLYDVMVCRSDDVVYVQTLPSEIRATRRALELPFNFWSLDFDGTDDYIKISDLNLTGVFTLSFWINIYSIGYDVIIGNSGASRMWRFQGNSSTMILWTTTGISTFDISSYPVSENTWTHLVITRDSSNSCNIFVNSNLADTQTRDGICDFDAIGMKDDEGEFGGLMSEVSVFNSVLSSSEISAIYNDGQPILLTENQGAYKSSGNLVSYYRMGSGSGDIREKDSAIFDQVNSGIGSELIDDTIFANADNTSDSTWGKWRNTSSFNALEDTIATFSNNTMTIHDDGSETPMSDIGEKDYFNPSGGIYLLTCDITRTAGRLHFKIGNASSGTNHGTAEYDGTWAKGSGTIIFYIQVGTNTDPPMLRTHGSEGFIGTVKNFSIKKLNGNPGKMQNFDSLDFRTNVPLLYDKALFSNSLVFDGTDDNINCGSDSSLDDIFDGGGSVSVWFNASAINTTHTIVSKKSGGTGWWAIRISDHSGNTGRFYFSKTFDGGTHYTTQQSTRDINPNTWYHAVVVYNADSASNRITAYINGEEVTNLIADGSEMAGTSAPTGTRISDASQDFRIGICNQFEFLGNIAGVALFNSTLDATNVTAIYNSGKPIDLTCDAGNYNNANNLVGYWKMGDGYLDELPSATNTGAIVDQVTPIIGDDVLSHNIDDWTLGNNSGATSTKAYSDGVYTITRESEGTGTAYTYIIQSGIENNTLYKVNFSYKTTVNLEVLGTYDTGSAIALSPTTEYIEKTIFILTNSTYAGKFQIRAVGNFQLKNLTYKKVNGNSGRCVNMNASAQSISVPK